MIFGGESQAKCNDIDDVFYLNVSDLHLTKGPSLPEKILPENPGYTFNNNSYFYFLGGICSIFRFDKIERTWSKIMFEEDSVF